MSRVILKRSVVILKRSVVILKRSVVILSGAKDRPTHAGDARASLVPPARSFAPLRMTL